MAADEELVTAAEVLDAWPAFGKLSATQQQSLIDTASQKILNFCRRGFASTMLDEFHDGKNQSVIWLKQRPVISINNINVNTYALDNSDGTAWSFVAKTGRLTRGNFASIATGFGDSRFHLWWPTGVQNIEVQYWAGYAAVPDPIIRGTIAEIRYLYERLKVSGIFSAESIGDYSYSLAAVSTKWGLPDQVIDMVMDYVQDDGPM